MSEQKDLEKNALATSLTGGWTKFKQGKFIGYKWMALGLILAGGLGLWWYISSSRKADNSHRWVALDEAFNVEALEKLEKDYPNTMQARIARMQVARYQLGAGGIDQLGSIKTETRARAVENIEKARDAFQKLQDEFKDDPVLKVECLLGLAKAEAALVAVPAKQDQPTTGGGPIAPATEYKGAVPKLIELLDKVAAEAAPNTPWATNAKKLADALRADPGEFIRVQRALFDFTGPTLPKFPDPSGPLGPFPPGGPVPPIAP